MAMEKENPGEHVQITENNGEVYRIPAADLSRYIIPKEKAYEIRSDGDQCIPKGSVVVMPPTKLLRLVRILIELDRLKEFKQHPHVIEHEIVLPSFAYAELSNFSGNKKTEANSTEFSSPISLQNFVELLEGVVRNNKFDQAITILRTIDTEMFLMIPIELSSQIKMTLFEISKTQKVPKDCPKVLFKAKLWL